MKSPKGEGTKLNQGKGVVASGDREPLFPRLHVNETEKQGPKAPPRNKMALYEQFTVPSHHFQPAQGSASTVLVQPNASGYPYIPYCFPSVAYGNANNVQAYTQPSQVTSSSDITIRSTVVNEESRKAPRHKKSGNISPGKVLRGFMQTSTECIASNAELQRGNFKVSMAKAIGDYTSFRGNVPMCKERPDISTKTESSHDAVSTLKDTMDSLHQRINCVKQNEIRKLESGNLFSRLELSEGTSKTQASSVSFKSQTEVSGFENDSVTQSLRHDEHYADPCQKYAECKSSEKNDSIPDSVDKLQPSVEDNPGLASNERLKSKTSSSVRTDSPGVKIAKQINSNFKDFEELKTVDNMPGVSHHAGHGTLDSSDDSVLSLKPKGGHHDSSDDWMPSLKPKDVILAIGQQQFWKARKMLLRQQRIFSDQVFQLHKLIMTQQLLAQTPGTSIDEAAHFETLEEWNTPDPPAEGTVNPNCCARDEGCSSKGNKVQTYDAEGSKPLSKDVEKDVEMGMLESTHGGISAWGYPSLGQWLGSGVQGQPHGYPPLSGAFPLGLPYGSTVSFGIPFCGQQQEIPAEMGSNYGPATVSKPEPSGVKRGNFGLFSNELANSWYVMQHNSLNQQRMHYGVPGKDAPTGSGTSVNKASLSAGQGGRTSCFPGLLRHRSIDSQPRDVSNTEGLDSSGPHSEISSPSIATKLACSSSPLTPSIPMTKKKGLKEGLATGHRYVTVSLNRSHSFDSRRLGDEEEADARVSSKALKEGCSYLINDASLENSLGMGGRALELFPLVPSLSVRDQIREQESKVLEMGQGSLIRAVPRRAVAASESTAGILLSLQEERRK